MTYLDQWAQRHNVPFAALLELQQLFFPPELAVSNDEPSDERSEAYASYLIRQAAARQQPQWWLGRNNVGALTPPGSRRPVRYGLANDSAQLNEVIKSGDFIGLRPVLITEQHLGTTIGQFVSIEAKDPAWQPGEDPKREKAQFAWAGLIRSKGGLAVFSRGELPE